MENNSNYSIPAAIVIAGLIIAGAIYYGGQTSPASQTAAVATPPAAVFQLDQMAPVSTADHLLGNPQAPLTFVEYSDLECPFCKLLHLSMTDVFAKYGNTGKIALVYRHFPLDNLHSKARNEAAASECAYQQGGNEKFWAFVDKIFAITPSNNGLDPAKLPEVAKEIGLDRAKFEQCLSSGQGAPVVTAQANEGTAVGVDGTPFIVVLGPNNLKTVLRGPLSDNTDAFTKEVVDYLQSRQQENMKKIGN